MYDCPLKHELKFSSVLVGSELAFTVRTRAFELVVPAVLILTAAVRLASDLAWRGVHKTMRAGWNKRVKSLKVAHVPKLVSASTQAELYAAIRPRIHAWDSPEPVRPSSFYAKTKAGEANSVVPRRCCNGSKPLPLP
jgi:nucleoside-diphosphate-sugar epimerase